MSKKSLVEEVVEEVLGKGKEKNPSYQSEVENTYSS